MFRLYVDGAQVGEDDVWFKTLLERLHQLAQADEIGTVVIVNLHPTESS